MSSVIMCKEQTEKIVFALPAANVGVVYSYGKLFKNHFSDAFHCVNKEGNI